MHTLVDIQQQYRAIILMRMKNLALGDLNEKCSY